jgi:hypothetical protein
LPTSQRNVRAAKRLDITGALTASIDFLKKAQQADPKTVASLHASYQATIETYLAQAQKKAELAIGSAGLFTHPIRFANSGTHPARILEKHA